MEIQIGSDCCRACATGENGKKKLVHLIQVTPPGQRSSWMCPECGVPPGQAPPGTGGVWGGKPGTANPNIEPAEIKDGKLVIKAGAIGKAKPKPRVKREKPMTKKPSGIVNVQLSVDRLKELQAKPADLTKYVLSSVYDSVGTLPMSTVNEGRRVMELQDEIKKLI